MHRTTSLVTLCLLAAACQDTPDATAPAPSSLSADHVHGTAPGTIELTQVAAGLTQPVALVHSNDNTGRLFVVDQVGLIRVIDADGMLRPEPFLDLRGRIIPLNPRYDERGLLGLAFHPKYKQNGLFYVYYSAPLRAGAPAGYNVTSTISEFHAAPDANVADAGSERILLQVDKPQSNHNGGTVAFGPEDDFLYISIGDGGGANDVGLGHVEDWYAANAGGNGQDVTHNLLGNILRIDVDRREGMRAYGIPRDNPFARGGGLPEIYAYGFRNPWRFAFDPKGEHAMIAGDAGQSRWEEVDLVRRGGNYGWNVKEGRHCFNAANAFADRPSCPSTMPDGTPLIDPVIEYANAAQGAAAGGVGVTVIGGVVYRGHHVEGLDGRYVFGDWSRTFFGPPSGQLFVATPAGQTNWPMQKLTIAGTPTGELGHRVLGFGQDRHGEVYILTTDNSGPSGTTGKVFVISGPRPEDDDR